MTTLSDECGLGCSGARLRVYGAKPPPMAEYQALQQVEPLMHGQIQQIASHCGNGWRKVFNVYAKLVFALPAPWQPQLHGCSTWQAWRDRYLLQAQSQTSLLFSAPLLGGDKPCNGANPYGGANGVASLHLIAGRQHARALRASGELSVPLTWLDDEFAINTEHALLVCPYFDYRQLSDAKIARVAQLVQGLSK